MAEWKSPRGGSDVFSQLSNTVEWSLWIALSCLSVLISVCKLFVYSASLRLATTWLCAQSSDQSVGHRRHRFSVHSAWKCCSGHKWSVKLWALKRWTLVWNWPVITLCNQGQLSRKPLQKHLDEHGDKWSGIILSWPDNLATHNELLLGCRFNV